MGTFSVRIQVGDLAGRQYLEVDALVDTGSSDTVLPQDTLRELGVTPVDRFTYSLADETIVEYDVGEARIRLDGRERTTPRWFSDQMASRRCWEPLRCSYFTLGWTLFRSSWYPCAGF